MIFKSNGAAPSLAQVVALAQSHVDRESRRKASDVDYLVYYMGLRKRKTHKHKSKFEQINDKYSY